LHVPTLPLFPATVLKIDHRIGPVPDKAVIPLSVEFGFQFILGFFLYFSPHQPITGPDTDAVTFDIDIEDAFEKVTVISLELISLIVPKLAVSDPAIVLFLFLILFSDP
jgi:hypothetical protein